ncbi:MAG TPA: phosphatidylglycerophosphatase A [Wenzhouxiangellaceae bacterium]|nr:phosphatidylglycerophosphatase A [Wenzhouxiangellaceae bacterium]
MQREPELDTKAQMLIATGSPSGFLAFGLGAGLSPKAPGTAGTLAGMLLGLPLAGLPVWAGLLFVAIAFLVGIPVCDRVSKRLGVHDHGGIVWDEFVGIWLLLVLVPFHWTWWLAAFLAFRFFDVAKPWPIGWLDRRVHGGFGIMLDDLIAALYAAAVLGSGGWLVDWLTG